MSNEKWWFGLVSRTFAKMCPALGIAKEVFAVHHKKHISKVMAHATVGYLFTGDPENGGEGILVQLKRCQAYKVAQNAYRGKGGRPVKKGDMVLTDCNVTGTDVGTPDKPKFSLRLLWEYCLLPSLDALVAIGGQCEGAMVVHQEDNAGTTVSLNILPTPHVYQYYTLSRFYICLTFLKGLIRRAASMYGLQMNSSTADGNWNCKRHKDHIQTSSICRYSPQ
jgi:hypothetical protein